MHWWRVEFDASGAIASCAKVEKSARRTLAVRYVRAPSRKEAIALAQRWHERRKQLQRESSARLHARRKEAGTCIRCNKPLDGTSKQLCVEHFEARKEWKAKAAKGLIAPRPKGDPVAMHKRELEYARRDWRLSEQLPDVLARYDALDGTRSRFRAWLVDEMAAIEARYPIPG